MNPEWSLDTIAIIKLLSVIVTAAFTILGIMTDYKKDGKVTLWGRVAAIGATLSLLFSALLLGLEQKQIAAANRTALEEKRQANEKFDTLLKRVEDNVQGTGQTLTQTREIADGVKTSVGTQAGLITKTGEIASGLDTSIRGQNNILSGTRQIASSLQDSIAKQQLTLGGIEQVSKEQLASNEIQKGIQNSQEALLRNSLKALTRLDPLAFYYRLSYPLDDPKLKDYVKRIKDMAEPRYKARFNYDREWNLWVTRKQDNGEIESIEIGHGSKYLPSIDVSADQKGAYLLNDAKIALKFFKDAQAVGTTGNGELYMQVVGGNPDWGIPGFGNRPLVTSPNQTVLLSLSIDFEQKTISQKVFTNSVTRIHDRRTIISLVDLPETVLEITLPHSGLTPTLESFEICTGENYTQYYGFDPKSFESRVDPTSHRLYRQFSKDDFRLP